MRFKARLLLPITPELKHAATVAASRLGISLSEFVRQAIAAQLDDAPVIAVHMAEDDPQDYASADAIP